MPRQRTKLTIDVNAPESEIIKQLNDFQPAMLSGYPSNPALLADFDELDIHPDVVITGGELLTDDIRKKFERKFPALCRRSIRVQREERSPASAKKSSKGLTAEVMLSDVLPQANKARGRFQHIYKDLGD